MNGTHLTAASGVVALLAQVFYWILHWPIQPIDNNTATALAGLVAIVLGGGGVGVFNITAKAKDAPKDDKPAS